MATSNFITPTSGGSVTDFSGNVWTLDTAGNLVENGNLVSGGAGTGALTVVDGTIWAQDASTGTWYTFDGSNFNSQGTNVPPSVPTTTQPTVPTTTPTVSSGNLVLGPLTGVTTGTWVNSDSNGQHNAYLLPHGYSASDSKTYSMIMYLHYNSQAPASVLSDTTAYFNNVAFRSAYPALVVVPYYTSDRGDWGGTSSTPTVTETATIAVAQRMISSFKIDPNRVYIMGCSQGGIGSWAYIIKYNRLNGNPKLFQAALIYDGNPWVFTNQGLPNTTIFNQIKNVPVNSCHGSQDTTVSPSWDNSYWSFLGGGNKDGSKAPSGKFWLLEPNMGHGTWNQYLPLPTGKPRFDWLFGSDANIAIPTPTAPTPTVPTPTVPTPTLPTPTVTQATRDWRYHPGGNKSPINTPLGDGCIWGTASDADTQDLRHGGYINPVNNYGMVFWINNSSSNPSFNCNGTISVGGQNVNYNVNVQLPTGSYAAGPFPGDNQFAFCDPVNAPGKYIVVNGGSIQNLQSGQGPFTIVGYDDATSDNFGNMYDQRSYSYCKAAGLIRDYDIDPTRNPARIPGTNLPAIQHMLQYCHDAIYLKANGPDKSVGPLNANGWFEYTEDYQGSDSATPFNNYSGNLLYGTTVGIPLSTPMPAGLTDAGKMLFWTLQHYGSFIRDQAGGGYHLNCDQNVSGTSWLNDANADLPKIVQLLCPLRNQHQGGQSFTTSPMNGPGNRVDTGPALLIGTTVPTPTVPSPTVPTSVPTVPTQPTPTIPTPTPTNVPTVPTSVPTAVPTPTVPTPTVPTPTAPTPTVVPTRPTPTVPTVVPPNPTLPTPVGTAFVNYPLSTTATQITLTGLQSNTTYDFEIVATNNLGYSVSPYITVTTAGGAVPTAPTPTVVPTQPTPTAPTPTTIPTPTPTQTESASGTQITAGSGRIVDSSGIIWTVTTSAQVAQNGTAMPATQSVSLMYYWQRVVYYKDAANNWFSWNGSAFAVASSPLSPTPTAPTPTVVPTRPTPTVPTPTVPTPTVPTPTGTGQFFIQNGKIYDPSGNLFIARGLNADGAGTANSILNLFPNINFVRYPIGSYDAASNYVSFVNTMTARKIVVEFEYHPWPLINESPSGNYQGFIQNFATTFKNNPYVWIGSLNEPQGGSMSPEHQNVYNWVRAIDSYKMCMFVGGIGGGNPNNTGIAVLNAATYKTMRNIVWDLHFYGWSINYSTNQTTSNNALIGNTSGSGVLSLRQITSLDGQIPIINGEFGPSTSGQSTDANASQIIQTVTVFGVTNGYTSGYAGWGWDQDPYNAVQSNGTRTSWGNSLNSAMAATATYAAQQSGVPTPPSIPTSPTVTTPTSTGGGTLITPTSGGSVQDAAGNTYTLDAGGNIMQNGAAVTGGAGTGAITVVSGTLWAQDAATSTWYTYSNGNFVSQGSAVPPSVPTTPTQPTTPTVPTPTVPTVPTPTGSGTRKWYQVIGGDRGLVTTPFQTTASWITSGTLINQLRGLTYANVRSFQTTGYVSPFWVSTSTSDPLCTFHDSTGTIADFQMHVPAGAYSENGGTGSGDNSAGFIDTSIPYKYVTMNDCRIGSNSSNASPAGIVSATNNFIMCGPGFGQPGGMIVQDATGPTLIDAVNHSITTSIWENGDNVSGCITYYDLQQCIADPNYVIQHLIGCNLGVNVFSSSAQLLWPLVIGDVAGTGSIPEGCIIGIPASTPRPTGKSRGFYALFDLFQHFGAMFNNVTQAGQIGIKTMPRDTATANLVADMASQFINVLPFLCILNYQTGVAGAQYSLATLKGRLANATAWSDAFPAPPTLDFSQTGGVSVAPNTFGAWQAANGLGVTYSTNWTQAQASTGIAAPVPTLVSVPTTWFKSTVMSLSNNNMTATSTGSTAPGGLPQTVASTSSLMTGKIYFEITMQAASKDFAVGLITQGFNYAAKGGIGSDANSIGYYPVSPTQAIYINGKQLSIGATSDVSGAVLSIAIDFSKKLFWVSSPAMRKEGHPWNNSATANPATGTGGVSMSLLAAGPYFICYNNLEGGGIATLNTGGARFNQSIPSGFTSWDGTVSKPSTAAIVPPMVPPESITWCSALTLPNMRWVGNSAHVSVYYDTDSYIDDEGIRICNQFLETVEDHYQTLVTWFNGYAPNNSNGLATTKNPTGSLINYFIVSNGSFQAGHCSCINADILVDFATVDKTNIDAICCEFLLELSEVFMPSLSALPDCDTYSLGEGLSNAMAIDLHDGGIGTTVANLAVQWLNETVNGQQRGDFVNRNVIFNTTDTSDNTRLVAAGCAVVFLFYLRYQLLYTWPQITAALDTRQPQCTLQEVYEVLSNDNNDPFPAFIALLNSKYPPALTLDTLFSALHLFPI